MNKYYPIVSKLQQKSKFFCPAKWTELYLYLNHGLSNSCHHPIPHEIPANLLDNPNVLHNTPHKLKMQQLMMDGHKPTECHMCWHIEDADLNVVSDRHIKSKIWEDDIENLYPDPNYIPKLIEVVFDNYCNLTCSYCDGGQSSKWGTRIIQNPLPLETDYRKLYSEVGIKPGSTKSEYFNAWKKWWPQVKDQIKILKISGGEPLLSKHFWEFLQELQTPMSCILSINSNFSINHQLITRFVNLTGNFKNVLVGVSLDGTGKIGEYARQGLDFNLLSNNIDTYLTSSTNRNHRIYLQSTVNIFSIWGLINKLEYHIKLKEKYQDQIEDLYTTVVRFPEFQNVLLLPKPITDQLSVDLDTWLKKYGNLLTDKELTSVQKIVIYLKTRPKPMNNINLDKLKSDFKKFLVYYNSTSKHDYNDVYPTMFLDWIESIK
jgi:organic radical activating enzyme